MSLLRRSLLGSVSALAVTRAAQACDPAHSQSILGQLLFPNADACGPTIPGPPAGLNSPSQTSASVVLGFNPPTTGSALNNGAYTVRHKTTGAWSTDATIQYCTPGSGTITDAFGNVWLITAGGIITVNTFNAGSSSGVIMLLLINGVIQQENSGLNWWGWQPTAGPMNSAAAAAVSWNINPGTTTSPLLSPGVTVSSLAASTSYNFQVLASNTSGDGFPAALTQATSSSQTSQAPAQAQAVGYNMLTATGMKLGTNWFPWTGSNSSQHLVQNADGSITDQGGQGNSYNAHVVTTQQNGAGFTTGVCFGGGFYIECTFSYLNPAPGFGTSAASDGWPSFWSLDPGFNTGLHTEVDFMESFVSDGNSNGGTDSAFSSGVIDWNDGNIVLYSGFGGNGIPGLGIDSTASLPSNNNFAQKHKLGCLWVPATASTTGYVRTYFDDVLVMNKYSWTQYNGGSLPVGAGGTAPNFSGLDISTNLLLWGTGTANPMTVYNVDVWQASDGNNVRRGVPLPAQPSGGGVMAFGAVNSNIALTNSNLTITKTGANGNDTSAVGSYFVTSGKWYWEFAVGASAGNTGLGIANPSFSVTSINHWLGIDANSWGYYDNTKGGHTPSGSGYDTYNNADHNTTLPDVIPNSTGCIALDMDNKKWWMRLNNGPWCNNLTGGPHNPATNQGGLVLPVAMYTGGVTPAVELNAVNDTVTGNFTTASLVFAATAPAGFNLGFSPGVSSGIGPVATSSFVQADFTSLTGKTVARELFGVSTASMLDFNFQVLATPAFQTAIRAMNPPLLRFNCNSGSSGGNIWSNLFGANPANAPNWAVLNNLFNNLYKCVDLTQCKIIMGIGGNSGSDTNGWSSAQFASACSQVATRFATVNGGDGNKIPLYAIEIMNEPSISDATYATYFNAAATAIHAVNPSIIVTGPASANNGGQTGNLITNSNTTNLGMLNMHAYLYCPGPDVVPSNAAVAQAKLDAGGTGTPASVYVSNVNSIVGSSYMAGKPWFCGEYNIGCGPNDGREQSLIGAPFAASWLMTLAAASNPPIWAGIWEVGVSGGYGLMQGSPEYTASSYTTDAQGSFLTQAVATLPGSMVSMTVGRSGVLAWATKSGANYGVVIVNSTTSTQNGQVALSHMPTGGTINSQGTGTATLWTANTGTTSAINVTSGLTASIAVPANSVAIVSAGTTVPTPPPGGTGDAFTASFASFDSTKWGHGGEFDDGGTAYFTSDSRITPLTEPNSGHQDLLLIPISGNVNVGNIPAGKTMYAGIIDNFNSPTNFQQLYGYFEGTFSADRLPGVGLWHFVVCIPSGPWPPNFATPNIWTSADNVMHLAMFASNVSAADFFIDEGTSINGVPWVGTDQHTYGVNWTANVIEFYVDRFRVSSAPNPGGVYTTWPVYSKIHAQSNFYPLTSTVTSMGSLPKGGHCYGTFNIWKTKPF